jgi:hypothetical protein
MPSGSGVAALQGLGGTVHGDLRPDAEQQEGAETRYIVQGTQYSISLEDIINLKGACRAERRIQRRLSMCSPNSARTAPPPISVGLAPHRTRPRVDIESGCGQAAARWKRRSMGVGL